MVFTGSNSKTKRVFATVKGPAKGRNFIFGQLSYSLFLSVEQLFRRISFLFAWAGSSTFIDLARC